MQPSQIEGLFDNPPAQYTDDHFSIFREFKEALNRGQVRAAEPDSNTNSGWRTHTWVKKRILLGFRMGVIVDMPTAPPRQPFIDKSTYPVRAVPPADGVRIVPGGSS